MDTGGQMKTGVMQGIYFGKRQSRFWLWTMVFAVCLAAGLLSPARSTEARMPVAQIGSNKIKLEVAASEQEITRGLMYRTSLAEDSGMVFLFHPPRCVKFWMAHCFISLDMLFVKDGKIIKICQNVPPCRCAREQDCPTYPDGPPLEVSEVVEVAAGYAKKHGIKEGDAIKFLFPKPGEESLK